KSNHSVKFPTPVANATTRRAATSWSPRPSGVPCVIAPSPSFTELIAGPPDCQTILWWARLGKGGHCRMAVGGGAGVADARRARAPAALAPRLTRTHTATPPHPDRDSPPPRARLAGSALPGCRFRPVAAPGVPVEQAQDLARSALGGADRVREHRRELRGLVGLHPDPPVPEQQDGGAG